MDISSAINQTKQYMLGTREFIDLKNAQATLKKNPKATALVNQFRKKEESIYSSQQGNGPSSQFQYLMDELGKDYEKLMTIPEIGNYFNASDSFNLVLDNFIKALNQAIVNELA